MVSSPAAMEVKSPSVVEETMEKDKLSHVVNTSDIGSYPPLSTQETTSASNAPGKSSYANVTSKPSGKKLNIHTLFTPRGNGIDVVVPVESVRSISDRFTNTAYDFFLGKRVAYPVVANYVRNTWGKYGLVGSMFSSSTRLFSFQFSSMDGLNAMLENGPWFIQNYPLILKKWHSDENLLKEDVILFQYSSYTSDMCMQSWGRSSYARVMIELRADVELKDNIVKDILSVYKTAINDNDEDERVELANLIANLKLNIDENKKIQKQLRKANATLTHELNESKYALTESNDIRDRCRSALHQKEVELEKYITYKNCQLEKEEIERKYKETLDLLAQQKHQSHEALRTQAYETFQFKEKNVVLINQGSLENIDMIFFGKKKNNCKRISK
ncbi:putative reverse transcriptase domain-containing protein [Tanacetum coccineum]